ncbi:hypothetical protein N018_18550 [Pseudomonas syringae CC1557]|uniref:Integrase catalytic domain-containing protein n=1 Tax=Pseudomonas syringae CC1557 TaxID=1357279 RepID=W0N3K9_PSESX|nr:hypothetical protein N018_18550 [Pseudomonas syringae CC1557]
MDLYARRIVGWAFSNKPDTDLVIKALDMAYEQRGKPHALLYHSDRARNMEAGVFASAFGDIACVRA